MTDNHYIPSDRDILIIPDVHGRRFWEKAVTDHPDMPVVFLGDYLDPYSYYEHISITKSIKNFRSILEFKKENPLRVTLLLGNHDVHYFSEDFDDSRKDFRNEGLIRELFMENLALFRIAVHTTAGDQSILLSHAGVIRQWFLETFPQEDFNDACKVCHLVNAPLSDREHLIGFMRNHLDPVPVSRRGDVIFGSIVWADELEHFIQAENPPPYFQIFGHTQQLSDPIITASYADLDCRRAFILTAGGDILKASES